MEDDPLVREVLVRFLERDGYEVVAVADRSGALAVLAELGRLDLFVIDVALAGESGLALAGECARVHPDAPVVFVSGFPPEAILHDGEITERNFVQKPFSPAELQARVRAALGNPRVGG